MSLFLLVYLRNIPLNTQVYFWVAGAFWSLDVPLKFPCLCLPVLSLYVGVWILNLFALEWGFMNCWISSIEWNLMFLPEDVSILSCGSGSVSSFESNLLSGDTGRGHALFVVWVYEAEVKITSSCCVIFLWYRRSVQWTEQTGLLASIL